MKQKTNGLSRFKKNAVQLCIFNHKRENRIFNPLLLLKKILINKGTVQYGNVNQHGTEQNTPAAKTNSLHRDEAK